MRRRLAMLGAVALAWPLLTAFSSATSFDLEAEFGGGGGYTYTGSPLSHGMTCETCHQNGGGDFVVELYSNPGGLLSAGYQPGQIYQITVKLVGERYGLDKQGSCAPHLGGCNRNAFVLDIVDGQGTAAGTLCPSGVAYAADGSCSEESGVGTTLLGQRGAIGGQSLTAPLDCAATGAVPGQCVDVAGLRAAGKTDTEIYAAISAAVRGSTSWTFQWRAPASDEGDKHLYIGVVDGNGGTTVDPTYNDYFGDGVVMADAVVPSQSSVSSTRPGCSAGGAATTVWGLLSGLAAMFLWRRRRIA